MIYDQPLPEIFCWTRFGTEAGQSIERILDRKESERRANQGVFYWGIGNSIAPAVAELVRVCDRPEVLFSPIKGRPRAVDVLPRRVVAWTVGETLSGGHFELPGTIRVMSRGDRTAATAHYALVCRLDEPLTLSDFGRLEFHALRNLLSGNPVGASQVTAVVRHLSKGVGGDYQVAIRAQLVAPYFVRLREPVAISA